MNYKNFFLIIVVIIFSSSRVLQSATYVFQPNKDIKISVTSQNHGIILDDQDHLTRISPVELKNAKVTVYKIEVLNRSDNTYTVENNNAHLHAVNNYTFLKKSFEVPLFARDLFLLCSLGGVGGFVYELFWRRFRDLGYATGCVGAAYFGIFLSCAASTLNNRINTALIRFLENKVLNNSTLVRPREKTIKHFFISQKDCNVNQTLIFKDVQTNDQLFSVDLVLN